MDVERDQCSPRGLELFLVGERLMTELRQGADGLIRTYHQEIWASGF